jgi:thymidine kinase
MAREGREGSIEVITGVMFSGKSEELLRRVRRAMIARRKVQVFKSQLDDRYGGIQRISSHDGREIEARPVSNSRDVAEFVAPDTEVLAVDEVQFMDPGIVDVVNDLADQGVRVIVSGTDMDFRGLPFGPLGSLLAVAERIDKLHAICVICGDLATRNQRLIDSHPAPAEGPTIQVGGLESYEARCRAHHLVPSDLDDQMPLIAETEGGAS